IPLILGRSAHRLRPDEVPARRQLPDKRVGAAGAFEETVAGPGIEVDGPGVRAGEIDGPAAVDSQVAGHFGAAAAEASGKAVGAGGRELRHEDVAGTGGGELRDAGARVEIRRACESAGDGDV